MNPEFDLRVDPDTARVTLTIEGRVKTYRNPTVARAVGALLLNGAYQSGTGRVGVEMDEDGHVVCSAGVAKRIADALSKV